MAGQRPCEPAVDQDAAIIAVKRSGPIERGKSLVETIVALPLAFARREFVAHVFPNSPRMTSAARAIAASLAPRPALTAGA